MMQEEADAFIALPGGFGTVEELLEMITWQQLGIHAKPVGVLNTCGFYDHLIAFADHMVEEVSYSRGHNVSQNVHSGNLWLLNPQ